jgi:hypothetical protein
MIMEITSRIIRWLYGQGVMWQLHESQSIEVLKASMSQHDLGSQWSIC